MEKLGAFAYWDGGSWQLVCQVFSGFTVIVRAKISR